LKTRYFHWENDEGIASINLKIFLKGIRIPPKFNFKEKNIFIKFLKTGKFVKK